ncbi:unnamed protein product, partial [Urochloa humidicola]
SSRSVLGKAGGGGLGGGHDEEGEAAAEERKVVLSASGMAGRFRAVMRHDTRRKTLGWREAAAIASTAATSLKSLQGAPSHLDLFLLRSVSTPVYVWSLTSRPRQYSASNTEMLQVSCSENAR